MAGIRGARNPFPKKTETASGLFKQRAEGPSKPHMDVKAAAMASDRKGPPNGRNSGTSPNKSHHQNAGLKRGTSNRG